MESLNKLFEINKKYFIPVNAIFTQCLTQFDQNLFVRMDEFFNVFTYLCKIVYMYIYIISNTSVTYIHVDTGLLYMIF